MIYIFFDEFLRNKLFLIDVLLMYPYHLLLQIKYRDCNVF
ncbi:hypothetical protein B879_04057 [Cecembia lonarensis LW9]|uniref:Uncharacterized protein n=1 Tax=Cecembia lonarensis (strain CCUG 58316 / KCTC 22772 / LW9) TaxID=1225176 RepID=K1LT75_CECL9|nr:hypothetical protein B879_04057 [Cecembia lonarensis LW9]